MGVFVGYSWVFFLCVVFVCVNGGIIVGVFVGVLGCVCFCVCISGCFVLGCGLGWWAGPVAGLWSVRWAGLWAGPVAVLGGLTPCHVAQPRPPPWTVLGRMARFTIGCGLNAPVALIN